LIPETKVELNFERRRPPLEFRPSQLPVTKRAQLIYAEIDKSLSVIESVAGGGTDAAFAALNTPNPVVERFGLLGFGAHSNDNEYILIDSIAPRLYLATRLIQDFSRGLTN
jgi:glutamate carboxypeptidase